MTFEAVVVMIIFQMIFLIVGIWIGRTTWRKDGRR